MKVNIHFGRQSGLIAVFGLIVVLLSFTVPSGAGADWTSGGDSWNCRLTNNTGKTLTVKADSWGGGNVWFNTDNENGPFQIGPHSSATMKYTTTHGLSKGDISVSDGWTENYCGISYNGIANMGMTSNISARDNCNTQDGNITINK